MAAINIIDWMCMYTGYISGMKGVTDAFGTLLPYFKSPLSANKYLVRAVVFRAMSYVYGVRHWRSVYGWLSS